MNKAEAIKRLEEIKQEQAELEAIINEPERWQDELVQPDKNDYYYIGNHEHGFRVFNTLGTSLNRRKPEHAFRTREQAELIKDKVLLMQEMHAFAHVRNGGWMPDWHTDEEKYGIFMHKADAEVTMEFAYNEFVFGVAVKSQEIAKEMLEIFGKRIEKFYNKQY